MNLIEYIISYPCFVVGKVENSQLAIFVVALYYGLWYERNNILHNNIELNLFIFLWRIRFYYEEHRSALNNIDELEETSSSKREQTNTLHNLTQQAIAEASYNCIMIFTDSSWRLSDSVVANVAFLNGRRIFVLESKKIGLFPSSSWGFWSSSSSSIGLCSWIEKHFLFFFWLPRNNWSD